MKRSNEPATLASAADDHMLVLAIFDPGPGHIAPRLSGRPIKPPSRFQCSGSSWAS